MPPTILQTTPIIIAGCGNMGLPMAEQLLADGYAVSGFDVRPSDDFESANIAMCGQSELTECEILISVVRDAVETDSLCFGEHGVFTGNRFPSTFIVCSTLKPAYIRQLQARLPEEVALVDAPMSGAPVAAREGRLTFMLGGDNSLLNQLWPLFEVMGEQLFRAGSVGSGMTMKVLNNYVAAASVVSVRRVLDAARKTGLSAELLLEVMSKSSGATWYGNRFDAIDWAREGYATDNTIGILEKDVRCALDVIADHEQDPELDAAERIGSNAQFDVALLKALKGL